MHTASQPPQPSGRLAEKLMAARRSRFVGRAQEVALFRSALLADAEKAMGLFGQTRVGTPDLLTWVADWVSRGGESLEKPTHFEARDGKF